MVEDLAADAECEFGEKGLQIGATGWERSEDCVLEVRQECAYTFACLRNVSIYNSENRC